MLTLSEYCVFAGIIAVILALVCYALAFASLRVARARTPLAEGGGGEVALSVEEPGSLARFGTLTTLLALGFLSAALLFRWFGTGHGPFVNMYEFSVAFAWGALAVHTYLLGRYRQWTTGIVVLPVALALLLYATTVPSTAEPLVPALQNNLLLTVHVAVAVIAYGAFSVGFGAAILYLVGPRGGRWPLPGREILDDLSYRATLIGFPFLTLTIVLGALWANIAWGKYWSWDPKESASLVTWLICGAYLHARSARGWRGRRAALLLMVVFAATLFTYFGNLFFGGLHSYAG
jgi:ABC-type transport system involved in cytochrome c biogenesis permease subunit